tara:strand:- start:66 stop:1019 length:954 start_codon:yes stop_codon:yes gene_type:complete
MAWYSKDYSYPIPRWKFPHRLKDENGKSYTGENAFDNRHKLGWIDVPSPPTIEDTQKLTWLGHVWYVTDVTDEKIAAQWKDIRSGRDNELSKSDWTQIPVSNVVFNTIELSSDAVYSTFSMTSNNAAIAVDDAVTFGSVTGIVTDVYMVTPPYDMEEEVPDDVVTVKAQMTEHVANGSIINFTTAANTEVSFTGVVANTVSEAIIDGLAVGETITSGSVTVDIHEIVVANSTANIIRVITPSDIPTGAVTLNSTVTFAGTADAVTSMAAYGYPGNYIDANVHSQFVTYRQELRDLPATYAANVYAVVYPSYPDYQVD